MQRRAEGRACKDAQRDTQQGRACKNAQRGGACKDAQRGHAMMRRGAGVRARRGRGGGVCDDDAREMGVRGMRRVAPQDDEKALSLA